MKERILTWLVVGLLTIGLLMLVALLATIPILLIWNLTLVGWLRLPLPSADFWAAYGVAAILEIVGKVLHGSKSTEAS